MTLTIDAVEAGTPAVVEVSALWREYLDISLAELAELLSAHVPIPDELDDEADDPTRHFDPVLLARLDGEAIGSAGLEDLGGGRSELKRLYVRPGARRLGVARALVERAIEEARARGQRQLLADTLVSRHGALALFRDLGFREVEPWRDLPIPLVYQALDL